MATVLSVSGSPSATSRTTRLLRHVDARLTGHGHRVIPLEVRSLPPAALLSADTSDPRLARAIELFAEADGVVIGTPVYKAAYSGLLKTLLDVLPQYALAGKTVLPLATGGSTAHVLAVDYALRPVLSSMGAGHITQGWFVLDRHISTREDGSTLIEREAEAQLTPVVDAFATALVRQGEPVLIG
ncbi:MULTISPECIES: NADPH-dependent FMN reductase [unclassified Kitasatospora]|uniref:NADPH-dependent FMN reductase n=1 Tax=unclassified Kitasatospora TaxID=2633591 RepID=UPI00070AAB06|nr:MULTISPECIES: NADPH-dependent FMN reductase [unclassified Kitasatospora]KQV17556.1 NADPH-dependent FMN reductase [Kitasatospora sp. Root107]KRB74285.1 NADPH-dependent FMN reductase [Kitasatospora sp. Root187]